MSLINYSDADLEKEMERRKKKSKNPTPTPLDINEIDWTSLRKAAIEYFEGRLNGSLHSDNDYPSYIFEDLMQKVYGEKVFDHLKDCS